MSNLSQFFGGGAPTVVTGLTAYSINVNQSTGPLASGQTVNTGIFVQDQTKHFLTQGLVSDIGYSRAIVGAEFTMSASTAHARVLGSGEIQIRSSGYRFISNQGGVGEQSGGVFWCSVQYT